MRDVIQSYGTGYNLTTRLSGAVITSKVSFPIGRRLNFYPHYQKEFVDISRGQDAKFLAQRIGFHVRRNMKRALGLP